MKWKLKLNFEINFWLHFNLFIEIILISKTQKKCVHAQLFVIVETSSKFIWNNKIFFELVQWRTYCFKSEIRKTGMIWFLETAISDNWFKSLIRDSPDSNPHFYIGMCGGVRAEAILKSGNSTTPAGVTTLPTFYNFISQISHSR